MTIKKINKKTTFTIIISLLMILIPIFIMKLWVDDFETVKKPLQAQYIIQE